MNKYELAMQMVKDASITRGDALRAIDALMEIVSKEMKKDGKLTLVGFGTFKTINKKQKKGRNPKTGAQITIPRKRVVKFVPGKNLKTLVK